MFPGQGAQRPGMLHSLPDHPAVAQTLACVADTLGLELASLDTDNALKKSRSVQLCLLISGVAMARLLIAENAPPRWVAGLSVGACPAAVTAGVLTLEAGLRFIDLRGRLMDDAFPEDYGMTAIMGLDAKALGAIIKRTHTPSRPVYLANYNTPTQLVMSGHLEAMQAVAVQARVQGATSAEPLAVAVPSHCPLFEPVATQLREFLAKQTIQRPRYRYLSSSAARQLIQPKDIATDLANNVANPVHWYETARLAWEYGLRLAIEMPGGSVLSRLTASAWPDGRVLSSDSVPINSLISLIQRENTLP